jgi:hypothetical protein
MVARAKSWHTNREIATIRGTSELGMLLRENGIEFYGTPGYFLVDSANGQQSRFGEVWDPVEIRKNLMLDWFTQVFESELTEYGLPEEAWPDTSSIEVFLKLFSVENHPLIADFGTKSLETSMIELGNRP